MTLSYSTLNAPVGHAYLSVSVSRAAIDTRERVFNLVGGADKKEGT